MPEAVDYYQVALIGLIATIIYTIGFTFGKYLEYRKAVVMAMILKDEKTRITVIMDQLNELVHYFAREHMLKEALRDKPVKTARKIVLFKSIENKHHIFLLFLLLLILVFSSMVFG